MSTLKRRLFVLSGYIATTFLGGCIQSHCESVACQNEGVCVQGICACPQGYEGDRCQLQWYEKFQGKWSVTETDKKKNVLQQYEVNAIYDYKPDTFLLVGLVNSADTFMCTRKSYRVCSILEKPMSDSVSTFKGGEATIDESFTKVTGLYSLTLKDSSSTVSFSLTR